MIVDEEQRFGVKQKERLRQLRLSVDVLALSATPIPRTLQMSLAGLRDISVIETPPRGPPPDPHLRRRVRRRPRPGRDRARAEARRPGLLPARSRRDDRRGGGAHPRAGSRGARRGRARPDGGGRARAPRCSTSCAGPTSVLVSTTIIESGLDIPQRQHARSSSARTASAWPSSTRSAAASGARASGPTRTCCIPRPTRSRTRRRRGSRRSPTTRSSAPGFKIAMRDLEIRGAGNLLGSEQSGHVAAVGFELYCRCWTRRSPRARATARLPRKAPLGAGPPRRPGRRLRAGRLHPLRGRQDRRPPPHRGGSRAGRAGGARGGAGRPLRAACRSRSRTCSSLQDARIRLGRAGARTAELRARLLTVSPIELDSSQARALREELGEVVYESLKRTLRDAAFPRRSRALRPSCARPRRCERVKDSAGGRRMTRPGREDRRRTQAPSL